MLDKTIMDKMLSEDPVGAYVFFSNHVEMLQNELMGELQKVEIDNNYVRRLISYEEQTGLNIFNKEIISNVILNPKIDDMILQDFILSFNLSEDDLVNVLKHRNSGYIQYKALLKINTGNKFAKEVENMKDSNFALSLCLSA